MTMHLGDVPASSVIPIPFASYGKTNGESITLSGLAVTDIEIYKGTSMTQRASDNGYALVDTDGIDIDSLTGIHAFSVDLSDNSDSGFYAVGSFYTVVVSTVTIDSQTVSFVAATFRIVAAESSAGTPKVDVSHFGGSAGSFASGIPAVNAAQISGDGTAADTLELFAEALDQSTGQLDNGSFAAGAIDAAAIANGAIDAATFAADVDAEFLSYIVDDATRIDASALNTATVTTIPAILVDTNELQADWTNGGRLDLIIDDILVDTGTTLQGELDGIQADTEDIQTRLPAALVNSRMDCTIDGTGMESGAVDAILNRDASASTTNSTLGAIVNDLEDGGRLDLLIDALSPGSATNVSTSGQNISSAEL